MRTDFNRILPKSKVNTVVKRLFLSLLIIVITGLLWVTGFPFPYLLNNYRLNSFADQLNRLPLPPQTNKNGPAAKKFGNLGPCSKHGDYFAEFKIASSLSLQQLRRFYGQAHVQVPEINKAVFSSFRGLGTHGPQAIEIEKVVGAKNSYLVRAFDPGYWPNDFRCW